MSRNQLAELTVAVLRYVVGCIAHGDEAALLDLGLESEQLRDIAALTLEDIENLDTVRVPCLEVRIQPEGFQIVMNRLARARRNKGLQLALIQADAPERMMRTLFGMNQRDYSRTRRMLGVETGVGRPPSLDEETAVARRGRFPKRQPPSAAGAGQLLSSASGAWRSDARPVGVHPALGAGAECRSQAGRRVVAGLR